MSDESSKTVRIRIDGVDCEVDRSRSVLEAALERSIHVPYFCYHPYLSVPGNCRQCQVKVGMMQEDGSVRWMPKLQVSCNTRVAGGMVVETRCDEVRQAQQTNMEFLLINHPLDCPICDQVGECWLQEHAYTSGQGVTRFREEKVHFDKRVDVGPHVLLDKERCIQCTRCIRFCDEVTGTSELGLFSRTDHTEVDIFPGRPLDNPYSGNVVDICPVGALTLKEFRFRSRLWFLKTERTVCPGCARGCNVKVWHRDNAIARITPVDNPEVNQSWICDHGRLIAGVVGAGERVREPRLAGGNGGAVGWDTALDAAAAALKEADGKVAAVISSWATLEEAYLGLELVGSVCGGAVAAAVPRREEGEDDALLIRADRTPNRRGLMELLSGAAPGHLEFGRLVEQALAGGVKTLLVIGEDLFDCGVERDRLQRALDGGLDIIALAGHENRTTERAAVVLPAGIFPEVDGTVVNFQGRVQRLSAAYPPPFLARSGVRILGDLAGRLGAGPAGRRSRDLFDEIGRRVASFRGLTFDTVGDAGVPLPGTRQPAVS